MPKLHIEKPHNEIEQRREGEAGCSPRLLLERSLSCLSVASCGCLILGPP